MNENRIKQVLEIEKQAQEIHDAAVREAQQLPIQAEQDAQAIIEKARAEAQNEARKLVSEAQSKDAVNRTLAEAEQKTHQVETLAMSNFERAVNYILDRVIGRV